MSEASATPLNALATAAEALRVRGEPDVVARGEQLLKQAGTLTDVGQATKQGLALATACLHLAVAESSPTLVAAAPFAQHSGMLMKPYMRLLTDVAAALCIKPYVQPRDAARAFGCLRFEAQAQELLAAYQQRFCDRLGPHDHCSADFSRPVFQLAALFTVARKAKVKLATDRLAAAFLLSERQLCDAAASITQLCFDSVGVGKRRASDTAPVHTRVLTMQRIPVTNDTLSGSGHPGSCSDAAASEGFGGADIPQQQPGASGEQQPGAAGSSLGSPGGPDEGSGGRGGGSSAGQAEGAAALAVKEAAPAKEPVWLWDPWGLPEPGQEATSRQRAPGEEAGTPGAQHGAASEREAAARRFAAMAAGQQAPPPAEGGGTPAPNSARPSMARPTPPPSKRLRQSVLTFTPLATKLGRAGREMPGNQLV